MRCQAEAWLILRAVRPRWSADYISAVRIASVKQRKPKLLGPDEVAIRVSLSVPDDAFTKYLPPVDAEVESSQVVSPPTIDIEDQT